MQDLEQIYQALQAQKRPVDAQTIAKCLSLSHAEAASALTALYVAGRAEKSGKGRYMTSQRAGLILCRVSSSSDSPTFARPLSGGEDMYLDMPDEIALNGDTALVRRTAGWERPRGTLARVIARANETLTGILSAEKRPEKRGKKGRPSAYAQTELFAVVHDRRLPARIRVEDDAAGARVGDLCLFEVTVWPSKTHRMTVRIKEALGAPNDMRIQLRALTALHGICERFDEDALHQADGYAPVLLRDDIRGRLDLRDRVIFTIDGDDAQDFDDAISLETANGETRLGVHIADVSHYVPALSPLDKAAVQRGTSVYLPGLTVPMLPEALSNNLCSLRPDEDRLTLSALFTLKGEKVENFELRESVIRSRARLTYGQVNRLFAGEGSAVAPSLHETLFAMNALAKKLSARRRARGALELDLPEPEFKLRPDFIPEALSPRARGDAHRLIEEFMLLANENVARYALENELPFPYRIHEAPDAEKLPALENLIAVLQHPRRLGNKPSPKQLQQVLDDFEGEREKLVVARVLLRSMSRARYSPRPAGHYGLAARDYCHFTSPIRRCPDLIAHRMLKLHLRGQMTAETSETWQGRMEELTAASSAREYDAALCERDADMLMCAAFMSERIGERFEGVITHLSKRGAFVTLNNTAEGRVPPQLMDDFYTLDESRAFMCARHTKKIIRLGDRMTVEVYSANAMTGEIEFAQC